MSQTAPATRLIVQPRPQLGMLILFALMACVGLSMLSNAKLTTVSCERDATGHGRCEVVEQWLVGSRHHRMDLREVGVDIRKGSKGRVSSHLVTPTAEFSIGGAGDGESLESYLATRGPGVMTMEHDGRSIALFVFLWLGIVGYGISQYAVTTTICLDRGDGRARVFYQSVFGKWVREAPLTQITGIEVASTSKATIQLAARLTDGGRLALSPPLVMLANKQQVADELQAFLAAPALATGPGSPTPGVPRVTQGPSIEPRLVVMGVIVAFVVAAAMIVMALQRM